MESSPPFALIFGEEVITGKAYPDKNLDPLRNPDFGPRHDLYKIMSGWTMEVGNFINFSLVENLKSGSEDDRRLNLFVFGEFQRKRSSQIVVIQSL